MKKKPHLFFDFDEFIVKSKAAAVAYINKKYGINTTEEDHGDNDSLLEVIKKHDENLNVSFDEAYLDIGHNFHASIEVQKNIPLMEGAKEIIPWLSEKYHLWIVTARQKVGLTAINHILDEYFPGCFQGVHCVWDYIDGIGYSESSKKDFILSIPGERVAFIDDSPKEIQRIENIIPTYLFDPKGAYSSYEGNKVSSWQEIGKIFL